VNVLHPLYADYEPPPTSNLCWWNRPGTGSFVLCSDSML
jgi:hypothetical protein